jgi:hypothetical protein
MAKKMKTVVEVPEELKPAPTNGEAMKAEEPVKKVKKPKKEAGPDDVPRLKNAIVAQAKEYNREQARMVVDLYYSIQKLRVGSGNKVDAHRRLVDILPNDGDLISQLHGNLTLVEKQAARGLKAFAKAQPLGQWCLSNLGVGPVITAGLLSHIDIHRAVTAGAIWRYAGLDPTMKWHGNTAMNQMVKAAFSVERSEAGAMLWLSKATGYRVSEIFSKIGIPAPTPIQVRNRISEISGVGVKTVEEVFEKYPIHLDNAVTHACSEFDVPELLVWEETYRKVDIDKGLLIKALSKRPWNAALKRLCWLLGESFKKVSNREDAFYGKLYKKRKSEEIEKNATGKLKDAALARLAECKGRRISPEQRELWASGKIQDKGLDLRAMRYVVKIFISHYHAVGRELNGYPPIQPWIIAHGGHVHYIPPPNWPMGKEAKEAEEVE